MEYLGSACLQLRLFYYSTLTHDQEVLNLKKIQDLHTSLALLGIHNFDPHIKSGLVLPVLESPGCTQSAADDLLHLQKAKEGLKGDVDCLVIEKNLLKEEVGLKLAQLTEIVNSIAHRQQVLDNMCSDRADYKRLVSEEELFEPFSDME